MTAPDSPQVEPLTLTLEEALQRLYAKGLTLIPPGDDTDSWGIGVASDSPDEEFDTWHEAVSAVEGAPVVPRDDIADLTTAYMVGFEKGKDAARDDTAELVEFLERIGAFDENLEAANSPELLPCFNQRLYDEWKQLSIAARAALARVKGGVEAW